MYDDVVLNEYGFYTLKKIGGEEEREQYYRDRYYQEGKCSYEASYTEDELHFYNAKLEQKLLLIKKHFAFNGGSPSLLDVGCGEGFVLDFFMRRNFEVLGLDYSKAGAENHNPDVVDKILIGDLYKSVNALIANGCKFDIVNLDNVLEHVTSPKELLDKAAWLLNDKGVVIINVPNDFSFLQRYFYDNAIISKPHWVCPLDHISYFNKEGLVNICSASGLVNVDLLGTQLIELFILNPNTNYMESPSVGKSCHLARVMQENIFHAISPQKTIELCRVLGDMGLGRNIIGVFKKQIAQIN